MRRAWAVRSGSEQRRWMLAAVSGIGERQRRAVNATVSDARVCLRQYLGAAGGLALALGCRGLASISKLGSAKFYKFR
jgi:hypothetical protein